MITHLHLKIFLKLEFGALDSVVSCVDEGVIFLAIHISQFTVNTCGNSCYNLHVLTRRRVPKLVFPKKSLLHFCSLIAVKVTQFVVSSSKNMFYYNETFAVC